MGDDIEPDNDNEVDMTEVEALMAQFDDLSEEQRSRLSLIMQMKQLEATILIGQGLHSANTSLQHITRLIIAVVAPPKEPKKD